MYYLRHQGKSMCHISWSPSRGSNRVPFWNLSLEAIEITTKTRGHCNVLVSFISEKNFRHPFSRRLGESHGRSERDDHKKTKFLLENDSRLSSLLSHVIDWAIRAKWRLTAVSRDHVYRRVAVIPSVVVRRLIHIGPTDFQRISCSANTNTVQRYYSCYPTYGLTRQLQHCLLHNYMWSLPTMVTLLFRVCIKIAFIWLLVNSRMLHFTFPYFSSILVTQAKLSNTSIWYRT